MHFHIVAVLKQSDLVAIPLDKLRHRDHLFTIVRVQRDENIAPESQQA